MSATRTPTRATLSWYAGPMPRPVVPILALPRNRSVTLSMATWYGMIKCASARISRPDGVDAAGLQPGQLLQQHARVDHHAVADHVLHAGREDARRDEVQREVLAVGEHHRVAGVVAALVAHHPLHGAPEQVGGLALALVAPLGADQHDRRHVTLQSSASTAPRSAEVPAGKGNGSRGGRRRERDAADLRGRT